jgi:hypothetical protein
MTCDRPRLWRLGPAIAALLLLTGADDAPKPREPAPSEPANPGEPQVLPAGEAARPEVQGPPPPPSAPTSGPPAATLPERTNGGAPQGVDAGPVTEPAGKPHDATEEPPGATPQLVEPKSEPKPVLPAAPVTLTPLPSEETIGVLGRKVTGPEGDVMGMVIDIVVDGDGRPRAGVIDVGGFLGVGSRKVAVEWRLLQIRPGDRERPVRLLLTGPEVQAAPEYKPAVQPVEVVGPPGAAHAFGPPPPPDPNDFIGPPLPPGMATSAAPTDADAAGKPPPDAVGPPAPAAPVTVLPPPPPRPGPRPHAEPKPSGAPPVEPPPAKTPDPPTRPGDAGR